MTSLDSLQREIDGLRVRVEAAEGVQAIQALKATYAERDDARFEKGVPLPAAPMAIAADRIAALFTADGVWDGGPALGKATGRAEIAARMREPTLLFSWHFFLKPRIAVDGDSASARWDILSPCTTRDGVPHWMVGFQDDRYRCVDGVWLHEEMKLTSVFMSPHETGWQKVWY